MDDILRLPRVAAIATMPSRLESLKLVLPAIRTQVDHVFVYLDGYAEPPAILKNLNGVSVCHAEEVGNFHASSRFLCLREIQSPTVVAIVDDDIVYPPNYVERLAGALQRLDGHAVVGVHGRIFVPPHQSYIHHAMPFHFGAALGRPWSVHELGIGTCAFISDRLPLDPTSWDRFDMDDIVVAIEAQKRNLPRISIARPAGWLRPLGEKQPDSLWSQTLRDDSEQSRRMRLLLGLYA